MKLTEFLTTHTSCSNDDVITVDKSFKTIEKAKGTHLVHIGETTKKFYFLESGLARIWYDLEDREVTQCFFVNNSFWMSLDCVFFGGTSPYNVTFLESSVLRTIEYKDWEGFFPLYPGIATYTMHLFIGHIKIVNYRITSFQFHFCNNRYNILIQKHSYHKKLYIGYRF